MKPKDKFSEKVFAPEPQNKGNRLLSLMLLPQISANFLKGSLRFEFIRAEMFTSVNLKAARAKRRGGGVMSECLACSALTQQPLFTGNTFQRFS